MTKTGIFSATVFMAAALSGSAGLAADSNAQREAQDRIQIEKLMWHYARALDTEDADAYAAVYTPDGQFGSGATAVKGHEALHKMISDLRQRASENETKTVQKRQPMYHMTANSYLEFVDKDHARLEAYWMTMFGDGGADKPARVAAVGREVDELVRVNGQWLIKVRDVSPK